MSLTQRQSDEQATMKYGSTGRQYPDGDVEVTIYSKRSFPGGGGSSPDDISRVLTPAEVKWRQEQNRERAIRRAKSQVRRKVKAAGLRYFWTLTYKANVQERVKVLSDWDYFRRALSGFIGDFAYVAVVERQKRGAYHVHFLTDIFLSHELIWRLWADASSQQVGDEAFVWVEELPQRAATNYMSKYMAKAFDDPQRTKGDNLYLCSQGLMLGVTEWRQEFACLADAVSMLYAVAGDSGYYWLEELHNKGIGYANNF